jgi:hypothetical protein
MHGEGRLDMPLPLSNGPLRVTAGFQKEVRETAREPAATGGKHPRCIRSRATQTLAYPIACESPSTRMLFVSTRKNVLRPNQVLSRYPVLKIHATIARNTTRNTMVMPRLTPTLTSAIP